MGREQEIQETSPEIRSLVVVFSCHHKNTEKIATAIAGVLGAAVKYPGETGPEDLAGCDLVGFGSGIYGGRHHASLLDLAGRLPKVPGKPAFIFSTCGIPESAAGREYIERYAATSHAALREILLAKGYRIAGEFICAGFNTNSFLRFLGGINKGRPDAGDIGRAEEFARAMADGIRRQHTPE